jgi:hypothetical protein
MYWDAPLVQYSAIADPLALRFSLSDRAFSARIVYPGGSGCGRNSAHQDDYHCQYEDYRNSFRFHFFLLLLSDGLSILLIQVQYFLYIPLIASFHGSKSAVILNKSDIQRRMVYPGSLMPEPAMIAPTSC